MAMKCEVCQVSMNSSIQFHQHLSGQGHAKKLRLQQNEGQFYGQGRGQGQTQNPKWGQSQGPKQGQGRGRGRAIRGAGGRGQGSSCDQGGDRGRGVVGGSINTAWAGHDARQNLSRLGAQYPGQPQPLSAASTQGVPFVATLPGLEPLVMNAFNVTAAAVQSSSMGFGKGGQPNTSGSCQFFGSSQTLGNTRQPFDSSSNQSFGSGQTLGTSQAQGSIQPFACGQMFRNDQFLGRNQMFGNNPMLGNNQDFRNNPTFGNKPGFGNRKFNGNKGQNQQGQKAQRSKQHPPHSKPKHHPPDLSEPIVFGDNMGVVSVTMESENQLYCDICCVSMTSSEQAYFHYRGSKHNKKARVARLHEVGALNEDSQNEHAGEFYCSHCNITVNSAEQLKVHQEGARHKKMVEQRKRKSGETMEAQPSEKKTVPTTASYYMQLLQLYCQYI
ncbi:uncharacterized protein LOC143291179 isoform X2 [Babylonia areolata]|uniref:uncharacterized protein LOC143291179 isoform X2 n=1 Tax=Babylonia areolata TaxID=304850 RepID=UPI003FCF9082